jgi:acetyl-CoA acyltransferase
MSKNPRDPVVVAAVRTPVTKARKGGLKDTRPDDLMIVAMKGLLAKVPDFDPAHIEDVVIGTAFPEAEQGMNLAKIVAMGAGLPDTVPGLTINRFCSSGLQSLAQAAAAIQAGWIDCALTGGVESMTTIPMGGQKPAPNPALIEQRPDIYVTMGMTSENVCSRFDVSREDQDAFAASSHAKAAAAIDAGKFTEEIIPVETRVWTGKGWNDVTISIDDGVRRSTTVEGLAKLRAVFKTGGATTAGNASQVSDGAAATLVMSREKAEELGLPILGTLRSFKVVGVDPSIMGIGPAKAIPAAVEKAGISLDDVEVFEINEAFASQAVYCVRELGIDPERVNPNGGAIALGHPLGCSGARILTTLVHALRQRDQRYGVATLCVGVGQGVATVVESLSA